MREISIKEDWNSGKDRVGRFLKCVDELFYEPLSSRVNLDEYSGKISEKAENIFLIENGQDVAHIAFYTIPVEKKLFITSISIVKNFQGNGLGKYMLNIVKDYAVKNGYGIVELEADLRSEKLIKFYKKNGFLEYSHHGFVATLAYSVEL